MLKTSRRQNNSTMKHKKKELRYNRFGQRIIHYPRKYKKAIKSVKAAYKLEPSFLSDLAVTIRATTYVTYGRRTKYIVRLLHDLKRDSEKRGQYYRRLIEDEMRKMQNVNLGKYEP